jgi:acetyl-CoA acetyltransferase
VSTFFARNKVAIAGYAQSPIERRSQMSLGALTLRTARDAIADAGLTVGQIDGFVTTPLFPSLGSHVPEDGVNLVSANWLAQHLGVVPRYIGSLEGQLPGAVALAVNAIVSGAAEYVIIHRALYNPGGSYHQNTSREASGPEQWTAPQGFYGPIAGVALSYNEYVQRYGVADDALSAVVMECRKNGARIPWSYWKGKPLSREDYLSARVINDPVRMLDCDIPVDGVAAFVLTSAERAGDLPHRPVYISGYADTSPIRRRVRSHWPYDDLVTIGQDCVKRLWERAGVGVADVDYPQVYDGFSPLVYFWLELLGLCPQGEAHRMVADGGIDSDRPGAVPALASGGALGNGRMHGTPQMLECYLQLARRAAERQRSGISLAVACQGTPNMGGAVVYSAEAY